MISTKTVDWKIFQGGDNFLVAINLIYLVKTLAESMLITYNSMCYINYHG